MGGTTLAGSMPDPFHLAIPVHDIDAARAFYVDRLGCGVGRESDRWIDLDLYGHQVVVHLVEGYRGGPQGHSPVDGRQVPVPHFGVVLDPPDWQALADRLTAAGTDFVMEPTVRYRGRPGEQSTMFFLDPSGNALEFKSFQDRDRQLFAKQ